MKWIPYFKSTKKEHSSGFRCLEIGYFYKKGRIEKKNSNDRLLY